VSNPKAVRREVAVDLRHDWQAALRDSGFAPDEPSAWIAEGLLIYLPGAAQEQLFLGIDALACSGSRLAVEEGRPMDKAAFEAKVEEARASSDMQGQWWQMVYDEQCAPAAQWFSQRGWTAEATSLTDYLETVGRSAPTARGGGCQHDQQHHALVSAVEELNISGRRKRLVRRRYSGWLTCRMWLPGNQCSAQWSQCLHNASAWSGGASRSPSPVMISLRSFGTFG
jgi:hypothetical protein